MLITCDALLLDVDGTLVDSTASVERSWRRWADEHGVDPEELFRDFHGRRAVDLVRAHVEPRRVDAALARQRDIELRDLGDTVALPGAAALLAALPAQRWTTVTSADRALMVARLGTAGLPVPAAAVTSEDVTEGKPSPQGYLAGAAALGVRPDRCVVVEDAPAGVRAGAAAGATVLGLATTHRPEELVGADVVVADLASVTATVVDDGLRLELRPL